MVDGLHQADAANLKLIVRFFSPVIKTLELRSVPDAVPEISFPRASLSPFVAFDQRLSGLSLLLSTLRARRVTPRISNLALHDENTSRNYFLRGIVCIFRPFNHRKHSVNRTLCPLTPAHIGL